MSNHGLSEIVHIYLGSSLRTAHTTTYTVTLHIVSISSKSSAITLLFVFACEYSNFTSLPRSPHELGAALTLTLGPICCHLFWYQYMSFRINRCWSPFKLITMLCSSLLLASQLQSTSTHFRPSPHIFYTNFIGRPMSLSLRSPRFLELVPKVNGYL